MLSLGPSSATSWLCDRGQGIPSLGTCKVNKMCSQALSALALVVWGHTSTSPKQTLTFYPLPCPWYLEQHQ